MSRPQGHRKSQSTSALAVIADGGPIPSGISSSGIGISKMSQSTSTTASSSRTPRASKRHQPTHSRLGAVIEDEHTDNQSPGIDSDLARLQRAMDERKSNDGTTGAAGEKRESRPANGMDEVKAALNDVSCFGLDPAHPRVHQLISKIRSLRSSERRRLSALRKIERKLVQTCAQQSDIPISDLLKLDSRSLAGMLASSH